MSFLKGLLGSIAKLPALLAAIPGLLIGIHEVEDSSADGATKKQGALAIAEAVWNGIKAFNSGGGTIGKTEWTDLAGPLGKIGDGVVAAYNLVGKFTHGSGTAATQSGG